MTHPTDTSEELREAAERVNKLAVQKAQMTCREHGTGSPQLYRDFMHEPDRKLDEAFQSYYESLASQPPQSSGRTG